MRWWISSVARAVWAERAFTSAATTAKPRPAAPARAASIVALRASRLVWPEIAAMAPAISSMRAAACEKPSRRRPISSAPPSIRRMPSEARWISSAHAAMPPLASSAPLATSAERAAISRVVAASSSVAAAIRRACSAMPDESKAIQPSDVPASEAAADRRPGRATSSLSTMTASGAATGMGARAAGAASEVSLIEPSALTGSARRFGVFSGDRTSGASPQIYALLPEQCWMAVKEMFTAREKQGTSYGGLNAKHSRRSPLWSGSFAQERCVVLTL